LGTLRGDNDCDDEPGGDDSCGGLGEYGDTGERAAGTVAWTTVAMA